VIAQAEVKTILKATEIITLEKEQLIKIYIMSNKVIYAIYNDDDILMDAVKTRAAHHHIEEVFFHPVHGLDKAMGLATTRLAICILYGCVGYLLRLDDEFYYDSGLASRYWW
jgi:hypothetical protein